MELKLDRTLQERRIFPAIDISKSGTRREETLLSQAETEANWILRRELSRQNTTEVMSTVLQFLKNTKNNSEFVNIVTKTLSGSK